MLLKLLSYFFESKKLLSKKWALFLPVQTKKTIKIPDVILKPLCICHWRQSKHRALSWLRCCNTRLQHTWLQMQELRQNYSTSFGKKPPVIKSFLFFHEPVSVIIWHLVNMKSIRICSWGQRNISIWPCCRETISNFQTRTLEQAWVAPFDSLHIQIHSLETAINTMNICRM